MCFNCGCQIRNDDMGKGKVSQGGASLTEDDFKDMALKSGMSLEETKRNVFEMLKKQLNEG